MDNRTFNYYVHHASPRADLWESVESPLGSLLPMLFQKGDTVLYVGSGSGRDCATLLRLGVDAHGIEPVPALRDEAIARHPELTDRITTITVGEYAPAHRARYDGVLLSAVLMHIPDSELFNFILAIRDLVKPGGRLVVSVPLQRDDVDPDTQRDAGGRLFVLRSEAEISLFFERLGFAVESRFSSRDALGRDAVWATIVFTYSGDSPRPIDRVEAIINRDRKTSTYKFALLRALSEIATNTPSMATPIGDGMVRIPLDEVALLWAMYYWPLLEGDSPIRQNRNGRGPVRFHEPLRALITAYESLNGLSAYLVQARSGRVPESFYAQHREAMREIKTALKTGPITYAGDHEFSHHDNYLVVHEDLWREFVLMGHWITDSIIIRWAELSTRIDEAFDVPAVLERLLRTAEAQRQDLGVGDSYRHEARKSRLECAWTGRNLTGEFDVDHIIPFALRRDSSIWNLVPAASTVNRSKGDKLPLIDTIRAHRLMSPCEPAEPI
ncbi:MAG: methyltransferase domain-containing protein [Alkalispirochaeta sp.]